MALVVYMSRTPDESFSHWNYIATLPNECFALLEAPTAAYWMGAKASYVRVNIENTLDQMTQREDEYLRRASPATYLAAVRFLQQVRAWCIEKPDNFIRIG
jgi:hypothetical protein